jgi:ABC-type transport system substrate-binding protein
VLVGPTGERFTTNLWTTEGGDREIALIADYFKQVGIASEQYVVPGARVRDREYRATYPGMETSAAGYGDSLLNRIDSRQSAIPPNYSGTNRGHYSNPQLDGLIDRYRGSIVQGDQQQAAKAISDLVAAELPVLPLYFNPTTPAVKKGVKALDDFKGGAEGAQLYGTFTRNAHEWDLK